MLETLPQLSGVGRHPGCALACWHGMIRPHPTLLAMQEVGERVDAPGQRRKGKTILPNRCSCQSPSYVVTHIQGPVLLPYLTHSHHPGHWPLFCFWDLLNSPPLQDLCTCFPFCLEGSCLQLCTAAATWHSGLRSEVRELSTDAPDRPRKSSWVESV